MKNSEKTREKLIAENETLKAKISKQEKTETEKIEKNFSEYLLETANTIILTLDTDANISLFNNFAEKLSGYKKEEVLGKNWFDIFIPKRNGTVIPDVFKDVLKEMPEVSFHENHILCKNGSERLISWENTVLKNENGKILGVLSIGSDITERKQSEEALKESEEKYRNLVERANDGICIIQDGIVKFANSRLNDLWGGEIEEIIDAQFINFIHPDELKKLAEYYNRRLKGEAFPSIYESVLLQKSGNIVQVELSAGIINYHGKPADLVIIRDISKRKQAEEALKESEEKYRLLTINTLDTIWTTDLEFNITFVNNAIFNFLGYTPEEFIDLNPTDFTTPEGIKIIQTAAEQLIAKYNEGKVIQLRFESQQICKDGTIIDVEIRSNVLLDIDGNLVGFQGRSIDITKHKQAKEALQNSEERLHILFESAPDAYYINDLKGNLIDGNKAAEELMGYNKVDLIGKSFLKLKLLSMKDLLKASKLLLKNVQGKGTGPDEFILNRKDGSQVSVEIRTHPVVINNENMVLGIARDITERKQAEEALRESEELSAKLIASVPDIIIRTDTNGNIIYCNDALLKLFPTITFEDLLGKNMLSFFKEEDRSRAEENTKLMFEQSLGIKEYQIQFANVNYDFEINGEVLRDASSKPTGMVYVLRDITERKLAEENVRKRNEELEVFNKMTVGRELKMIKLKKEINDLLEKAGEKPAYEIVE